MNQEQQDIYEKCISNVSDVFISSTRDSSVIFDMKIDDDVNIKMSIVGQNGEKNELSSINFKRDDNLYDDFIKRIVSRIYNDTKVVVSDVVNLDGDNYYAFRMITENYDLFVIDGLEKEDANRLLNNLGKDSSKDKFMVYKNDGTGDILFLFITFSVLIVSLISIFVFFR